MAFWGDDFKGKLQALLISYSDSRFAARRAARYFVTSSGRRLDLRAKPDIEDMFADSSNMMNSWKFIGAGVNCIGGLRSLKDPLIVLLT